MLDIRLEMLVDVNEPPARQFLPRPSRVPDEPYYFVFLPRLTLHLQSVSRRKRVQAALHQIPAERTSAHVRSSEKRFRCVDMRPLVPGKLLHPEREGGLPVRQQCEPQHQGR